MMMDAVMVPSLVSDTSMFPSPCGRPAANWKVKEVHCSGPRYWRTPCHIKRNIQVAAGFEVGVDAGNVDDRAVGVIGRQGRGVLLRC